MSYGPSARSVIKLWLLLCSRIRGNCGGQSENRTAVKSWSKEQKNFRDENNWGRVLLARRLGKKCQIEGDFDQRLIDLRKICDQSISQQIDSNDCHLSEVGAGGRSKNWARNRTFFCFNPSFETHQSGGAGKARGQIYSRTGWQSGRYHSGLSPDPSLANLSKEWIDKGLETSEKWGVFGETRPCHRHHHPHKAYVHQEARNHERLPRRPAKGWAGTIRRHSKSRSWFFWCQVGFEGYGEWRRFYMFTAWSL